MNLRDYIEKRIEQTNQENNKDIRFSQPKTAGEIVDFYRSYDGLRRRMRALKEEQVEEYFSKGFAFAGAYDNNKMVGVVASKVLPEQYPYFKLPKNEERGKVFTLGGLFVGDGYKGFGLASKLSNIVTNGTEEYAKEEKDGVGMAFETSFDNYCCLKVLQKEGNFIGYYNDNPSIEGLTILLYRPYSHTPIEVANPNIILTQNQEECQNNLFEGVKTIANNPSINGFCQYSEQVDNGTNVDTVVLDSTSTALVTLPETSMTR